MFSNRLAQVERWIFADGDLRQIAALRVILSLTLLWRLTSYDYAAISEQSFHPISYMTVFPAMPSPLLSSTLLVIGALSAGAAALGLWSRIALPVAFSCALILFGMTTSTGKVMHNEVLLMLTLAPLALGTTDRVWSLRNPTNESVVGPIWPTRVALIVVCGAYFFSGLAKLTHSGPAWAYSENLRWILYSDSDGESRPNALALFVADHSWLARLGSASILLTELAFPLLLWRPRWRWLFLVLAIGFHVGTQLTLNLDYRAWIAVDAAVLVAWPAILGRARSSPIAEGHRFRSPL